MVFVAKNVSSANNQTPRVLSNKKLVFKNLPIVPKKFNVSLTNLSKPVSTVPNNKKGDR